MKWSVVHGSKSEMGEGFREGREGCIKMAAKSKVGEIWEVGEGGDS